MYTNYKEYHEDAAPPVWMTKDITEYKIITAI
jgi:hypothetical protein